MYYFPYLGQKIFKKVVTLLQLNILKENITGMQVCTCLKYE